MARVPGQSDRAPPLPPEPAEAHFPVRAPAPRKGRVRRALLIAGALVGTIATFCLAVAAGALLHAGMPPSRRLIVAAVNQVLEGTFRGRVRVTRLGSLRPDRIGEASVVLETHDGRRVASLDGVSGRVALGPLLRSLVSGKGLEVDLTHISVAHADVRLERGATGQLTVAELFEPAVEGPSLPPKPTEGGVTLSIDELTLHRALVHEDLGVAPRAEADLHDVKASLVLRPDDVMGSMHASLSLAGTVGGIPVVAGGSLDRGKVDASLDLPTIAPESVAGLTGTPGPLRETAALHAEAHGTLWEVDAFAHVAAGSGVVDLRGHVSLPGEGDGDEDARVTIAARDVDAYAFSGPRSRVSLDAEAHVHRAASGRLRGDYSLHLPTGTVAATVTPDTRASGTFTEQWLDGRARVAEPGAPIDLRCRVTAATRELAFDLESRARDLRLLPQVRAAGAASVRATGRVGLGTGAVSADVRVQASGVSMSGVGVDDASAHFAVAGTLPNPEATLDLVGHGLHAGPVTFSEFGADLHGTPRDLRVAVQLVGQGVPVVTGSARIDASNGLAARDVAIALTRGRDEVTARVASARVVKGQTAIDGIRLDGAGEPLVGDARMRDGDFRVRASGKNLDAGKIARILLGERAKQGGTVDVDVDLDATRRNAKGHVNLDARDVCDGRYVRGLDGRLRSTFDGRRADVHLDVRDADVGRVALDSDGGELAGGALDLAAWEHATGHAHVALDVDLARALAKSQVDVPVERLRGSLAATMDVTRDDARKRPAFALQASTKGLYLTLSPKTIPMPNGTFQVVGKPFHTQDLDAEVKATLDGETGEAAASAVVHDATHPLVSLRSSTTLPVRALLSGTPARDALLATPVTIHAEMPERTLDSLPPVLGTMPIRGIVGVTLDAHGTALEPAIRAEVKARDLFDADDATPVPLGVDATLAYDGTAAQTHIVVTRVGATVLDANANVALRIRDALLGQGLPAWEANADATFHEFPVGGVADFVNQDVDANVSGTIALHDLHKAGRLAAKLDMDHLVLAGARFPHASFDLDAKDGTLSGVARIDQTKGFAQLNVAGGITWGADVAPSVDPSKGAHLKLVARDFRAIAIAPFVASSVSELDGVVNANTTLDVAPGLKDGTMTGAIRVDKGVFESPAVGQEVRDLHASILMKPWGVWNVTDLSARGTSGRFTASAVAKMNGLRLQSADAHLAIAQKEELPIALQGTPLGRVWGKVDAKAATTPDGATMNVAIDVRDFHVDLDDASPHGVQSTEADPTIAAGVHDKHGRMDILPLTGEVSPRPPRESAAPPPREGPPPMKIRIVTRLGPDLEVKRGTMLKMYVSKGPVIDIDGGTRVSGAIEVPHGYVELQGKRFNVERALVTFTGQPPDNPVVTATAVYDSPDGTKVYADFVGPVKTGKLTLRSVPRLSQNEILALLLFGAPDGTFGQASPPGQQGNNATQAASLAGGLVTEGLNKAIAGIAPVDIQTRVNTDQSGNPRPEVQVALSRTISATVIYNLGVPPPGQNPDDTLLMIDWRFLRNYSTVATLGDKGTTILDLAWRYRY